MNKERRKKLDILGLKLDNYTVRADKKEKNQMAELDSFHLLVGQTMLLSGCKEEKKTEAAQKAKRGTRKPKLATEQ